MNYDDKEIAKFNKLAENWWSKKSGVKMLHKINPIRMKIIEDCRGKLDNLNILDVGCGGGILTEALAKKGAKVSGIDIAKNLIESAKERLSKSNLKIDYRCSTVEELEKNCLEKYDIISCMEMLEHVPKPFKVIKACSNITKKNGLIFFSTLNRSLKSYLLAIFMGEYILRIIPVGTHQYKKFIKPSEIIAEGRKLNLSPVVMKGINYNPLTEKFSVNLKPQVNYIVAFKKN